MADSKNIDGRGPYEAIGKVIRKLPVETKVDGGSKFEVGFPVCEVTEYLDEGGAKAVARLMNAGHAALIAEAEGRS